MAKFTTVFMKGKIYWAKVLGQPRANYEGTGREWTVDFEPDDEGLDILKSQKLADRFKYVEGRDRPFIRLKKAELNKEGNKNTPIRVYDSDDEAWDEKTLLGNGTTVDFKITIGDYGVGKKKGIYPDAIRVQDLVSYSTSEFGKMDGEEKAQEKASKKAAKKAQEKAEFNKDFGLDDDVDDIA